MSVDYYPGSPRHQGSSSALRAENSSPRFSPASEQDTPDPRQPPVLVQLGALHELRRSQTALERYVKASFASHDRLADTLQLSTWLSDSQRQPERLTSEDYWARSNDPLQRLVRGRTDFHADLTLIGDDDLATRGQGFDEALDTSVNVVRTTRQASPAQDLAAVVNDRLTPAILTMNDFALEMLQRCEREAEGVIESMKDLLTRIFERIETQRQTRQTIGDEQRGESAAFDDNQAPQAVVNQTQVPSSAAATLTPTVGESPTEQGLARSATTVRIPVF